MILHFTSLKIVILTTITILSMTMMGCGGGKSSDTTSNLPPDNPPNSAGPLSTPSVQSEVSNNQIVLSWSESNAESYRVIYWQDSQLPSEYITANRIYTTPTLDNGRYTVIVEAYDELGHSLFSVPVDAEVF